MITRRDFLKDVAVASAGVAFMPGTLASAQSKTTAKPKGDKVKIAYIGIGNRGQQIIDEFAKTGMVDVGADIFERGLCLPSDNKMTAVEQDIIIQIIRSCFE